MAIVGSKKYVPFSCPCNREWHVGGGEGGSGVGPERSRGT